MLGLVVDIIFYVVEALFEVLMNLVEILMSMDISIIMQALHNNRSVVRTICGVLALIVLSILAYLSNTY
jgi:hypothetical protein